MLKLKEVLLSLATLAMASGATAMAITTTVTFDGVAHGEIVDTDFALQGIASINVVNLGGGPDLGVIFDSTETGTADPDLEDAWDRGNLPSGTILGNMLIIQENSTGCMSGAAAGSAADICDDPDDEGSRDAGMIELVFTAPVRVFGFDLIDIEDANMDGEDGMIVFYDGANSATVKWEDYLPGGLYEVAGLEFGDNSANRIPVISASDLGLVQFDRVEILMGGSGAIDNVVIPEPTTAGLVGLGLAALAARRRQRL